MNHVAPLCSRAIPRIKERQASQERPQRERYHEAILMRRVARNPDGADRQRDEPPADRQRDEPPADRQRDEPPARQPEPAEFHRRCTRDGDERARGQQETNALDQRDDREDHQDDLQRCQRISG
jgi:hypothetical protein